MSDAIFVPTPRDVVERMLTAAKVTEDDVLYDLGSCDGRIAIEAAKKYGCRAVGIEIERDLIELSSGSAISGWTGCGPSSSSMKASVHTTRLAASSSAGIAR